MNFFFYALLLFILLLLPIFVRVDGGFSYDRKLAFIRIKIYGIKVLTLKFCFDEEKGVYLSVNGRPGKPFEIKRKKGKVDRDYRAFLYTIYFTNVELDAYVGGAPDRISLAVCSMRFLLDEILSLINALDRIDFARFRILPCYVDDPITVRFSITLFSVPALILYAFAHTTKRSKKCKTKQ